MTQHPETYIAWNGMVRKWKYTDRERIAQYKSSGFYVGLLYHEPCLEID